METNRPGFSKTRLWREVSGPLFTVCVAAAIELLSRTTFKIPNPPAFLLAMVVFSAFRGGLLAGLISAAAAWVYFAHYFSVPQQPFHYTDENLRRVLVWLVTTPAIALMVGLQRRHIEHLGKTQREVNTFLEHLLAASPGVLYRRRPNDMAMTYISGNVERILGYTPEEIVGIPKFWLERIHPDDRGHVQTDNERAWTTTRRQTEREYRFLHKDGTYRWLQSVVRFEYDEANNLANVLGFVLDVTERKQADDARRAAVQEADRANQAKSEFLSRMSHELRTPLNAVLGFAQILEMGTLTATQKAQVEHIAKGGRHLLALINEVLDIARIEAGTLALSLEVIAVRDTLGEAIALIRPMAEERGIRIADAVARRRRVFVRADQQRLKQVLLNLLSNAVKYNREGGEITLGCEERPHGRLRITVQDTGPGIPDASLTRLFRPFERIGAEHSMVDGTGLGLALSAKLMEAMQGTIGVDSTEGLGSTFWIELPTSEPPAGVGIEAAATNGSTPAIADRTSRTILYIEDNLSNLRLVEAVLQERPGIQLLTAMQGRLGMDLAREHRPDVIFLDLHLPDMAGHVVLARLRAEPTTRQIPVVVFTADATPGQKERMLAAGARAFFTKPLDVEKLLEFLDELPSLVPTGG